MQREDNRDHDSLRDPLNMALILCGRKNIFDPSIPMGSDLGYRSGPPLVLNFVLLSGCLRR